MTQKEIENTIIAVIVFAYVAWLLYSIVHPWQPPPPPECIPIKFL